MSSLKVDKTLINIAAKKALGKAHTATKSQTQNETIPSSVQVTTETTFGESVPNTVNTDTFYSAYVSQQNLVNDGDNGPVEHPDLDRIFSGIDKGRYLLKTLVRN